jgi:hypothetical protein
MAFFGSGGGDLLCRKWFGFCQKFHEGYKVNNTKKLEAYDAFRQAQYGFVQSFNVEKRKGDSGYLQCNVELILVSDFDFVAERPHLKLKFIQVTDLRVEDLNSTFGVLLNIYDISANQLEDQNFKVIDEENKMISLSCNDFECCIV